MSVVNLVRAVLRALRCVASQRSAQAARIRTRAHLRVVGGLQGQLVVLDRLREQEYPGEARQRAAIAGRQRAEQSAQPLELRRRCVC